MTIWKSEFTHRNKHQCQQTSNDNLSSLLQDKTDCIQIYLPFRDFNIIIHFIRGLSQMPNCFPAAEFGIRRKIFWTEMWGVIRGSMPITWSIVCIALTTKSFGCWFGVESKIWRLCPATYRGRKSQPEWSEDAEKEDCQSCTEQHTAPCSEIILWIKTIIRQKWKIDYSIK